MKIYEIGTGYTPIPARISAATEIVVEELTKAFLKQNVPVEIVDIASDNRAEHQLPIREVKVPGCFMGTDLQLGIMHKLKRVAYSVALSGELKKILRKTDEKVVFHFHNQYNLFFFLKLTSKKLREKCLIAYTNHSGIWRMDWKSIENIVQKRYFQEAECMKQADIVFLLNEDTKRNVMKHLGVPEERIVLIGNGVNTDVYHPLSPEEKQAAKDKWKLSGNKVILQVGSVNENKGQLRTVEYLLPILKKHSDLVFAYAGGIVETDYHQKIIQAAEDNGLENQIRYMGMLSPGHELNELYNCADATIFPSKFEAFGLVAVESMASGLPVFVDRNGMVRFDEGVIPYDRDNAADMIEETLFAEQFDNVEAARKAREFAVDFYSWDKIATEYKAGFERLSKQEDLCLH